MIQYRKTVELPTAAETRFYDITDTLNSALKDWGTKQGFLLVHPMHTTVAVYVNEHEPFLFEDLSDHLQGQVPRRLESPYKHDNIAERDCPEDEPLNAHAHLRSAFYGNASVTLSYNAGQLQLGTWQRVLFAEFDGPNPRKEKDGSPRKILLHAMGD